jgi:hypothetical protein
LEKNSWIFVYEKKNYNLAGTIYNNLYDSSIKLGVAIEEPHWIELESIREASKFDKLLADHIKKNGPP